MKSLLASACLCLPLAACVAPARLPNNLAQAGSAQRWMRAELYFGGGALDARGNEADAAANEQRWRDFLDREVTPRFPDGLSVYDVYGQWRASPPAPIERLHSKELMLVYADSERHRADIEAIRTAWKKQTGDQSVLRVTQPADVSF